MKNNSGRKSVEQIQLPSLAREQLKVAIKHTGSLTKAAEALSGHPGFNNIDRTTIHKWTTAPILPERAYLGLRLLQKDSGLITLRFAIPNVLWMLPLIMMTWERSETWSENRKMKVVARQKRFRPYGLLSNNGITISVAKAATGEEALDLLENGEVDIAFAAENLVRRIKPSSECFPLCSFGEAPIEALALSSKKISSAHHLSGCFIGHNPSTAVGEKVSELAKSLGIVINLVALNSVEEFVAAFKTNKINVAVGWEPVISNIKAKMGSLLSFIDFENIHPRPTILLMAAVNPISADPFATRTFLRILDKTLEFFRNKQPSELSQEFYREIKSGFKSHPNLEINVDKISLEKTLKSQYQLGHLESEPVLKLWEYEANAIK